MHVAYGSSFQHHISIDKKLNKPNKRCIQSEQKMFILKDTLHDPKLYFSK